MHKLLLADDSVTIQRVIELTFSGEDIHVVAVNDGEQAISRILSEQPDIVLADIGMPKKGGYDVAAFVKGRADLEHIPVLLLAGAFAGELCTPSSSSWTRSITCRGSNGLMSTPSQRTCSARAWSTGSNAPARSSTGMCSRSGRPLTNAATS